MQFRTPLATLALVVSIAGCAHAQQTPTRVEGTHTITGSRTNPRAPTAYFGLGWGGREEGRPIIAVVEEGSPAARAGLTVGDVLLSVNGRDTRERGPLFPEPAPGREYRLRVKRGAEERELTLVAAPPRVPQANR